MTTRYWTNAYDFFMTYFINGLDYTKTLREYAMLSGRFTPAAASSSFRELKKKYPDAYSQAKSDYLEYLGISREGIFTQIMKIAKTAMRDSDRLTALSLLLKYTETSSDAALVNACNKLVLEVVPAPTIEDDDFDQVVTTDA